MPVPDIVHTNLHFERLGCVPLHICGTLHGNAHNSVLVINLLKCDQRTLGQARIAAFSISRSMTTPSR